MVIDTSALLAIYLSKAESEPFVEAILNAPAAHISAGTLLEAGIVVEARNGKAGAAALDRLLKTLGVSTVAVDAEQVEVARIAFRKYGKGRHPANLNYGDCFAYALAATSVEPLLFKSSDFSKTDVVNALEQP